MCNKAISKSIINDFLIDRTLFLGQYLRAQVKMIHQVTMLIFGRKMATFHHERDGFLKTASQNMHEVYNR